MEKSVREFWSQWKNSARPEECISAANAYKDLQASFKLSFDGNQVFIYVCLEHGEQSAEQELCMGSIEEVETFISSSELEPTLKQRLASLDRVFREF